MPEGIAVACAQFTHGLPSKRTIPVPSGEWHTLFLSHCFIEVRSTTVAHIVSVGAKSGSQPATLAHDCHASTMAQLMRQWEHKNREKIKTICLSLSCVATQMGIAKHYMAKCIRSGPNCSFNSALGIAPAGSESSSESDSSSVGVKGAIAVAAAEARLRCLSHATFLLADRGKQDP